MIFYKKSKGKIYRNIDNTRLVLMKTQQRCGIALQPCQYKVVNPQQLAQFVGESPEINPPKTQCFFSKANKFRMASLKKLNSYLPQHSEVLYNSGLQASISHN